MVGDFNTMFSLIDSSYRQNLNSEINTQKTTVFLETNDKQKKKEIREVISLTMASRHTAE